MVSSTCPACERADANPLSGMYEANCRPCDARALSQAPLFFESVEAEAVTPGYRARLQALFGSEWVQAHEEVKRWAERIKAARAAP